MRKFALGSLFKYPKWKSLLAERGFASFPITFSGNFEDLLVSRIFDGWGVTKPSYLDIGAYAPVELSNTYLFYKRGAHGVLVEANPLQLAALRSIRTRDVCLGVGVTAEAREHLDFFIMNDRQLSTFDREKAERLQRFESKRIDQVVSVQTLSINQLMERHGCPDYISLDTEGNDLAILRDLDFSRFRPRVFCVETVVFSDELAQMRKSREIAALMHQRGYFAYADTFSNTIFVDTQRWGGDPYRGVDA